MDNILSKMTVWKKELGGNESPPDFWFESFDSITQECRFDSHGRLSVKVASDSRPILRRMVDSFLNTFFPSGYPYSVNDGYLVYTRFRALQHLSSAALSVLSTQIYADTVLSLTHQQSLLFAAGLRPTPAQATAVSWVLKDGMQHAGKLICSKMGASMDSEPKSWRILADVLYDIGTGLEVLSPLCPQLFLEVAGLGNFAKGMAIVAARATRLPIYSSFAKEGNLSDLFAKGEAISTLSNVIGLGVGIQLASTICSSIQGKMIVGPLLSAVHVYGVTQEMRAAPVNTLNPQRLGLIVADFIKDGRVSSPADLRYREDLIFPNRIIEDAGSVRVGRPLRKIFRNTSKLEMARKYFPTEKFLVSRECECTDMILEHSATGEDALRGWLVAAYAAGMEKVDAAADEEEMMSKAYEKMEAVYPSLASQLKRRGWHMDRFLGGSDCRFSF